MLQLSYINGPLSGTTRVSRYEKGKTNLDFTEARDSEWQWHQLHGPYASLHLASDRQPGQHPTTQIFTGRMPFLPPNQQRQSTEGIADYAATNRDKLRTCESNYSVLVGSSETTTAIPTQRMNAPHANHPVNLDIQLFHP